MTGVPFVAADSSHHTKGRTVQWPDLLIQHHTDGYDSLAWLTTTSGVNSGEPVSATYLMHRNGTPRAQLVRHADTPWTTGSVLNPRSITSEWERKWPEQRDVPDETYRNLGKFWADVVLIERKRGNPHFQGTPIRKQLTSHKEQYPAYTCPGNLDIDRIYRELVAALEGTPPDDDSSPWFLHLGDGKMAKYAYRRGFRGVVEGLSRHRFPNDPNSAALALFGPPEEDEWEAEDGRVYQRTRKVVLVYTPANKVPWDVAFLDRDAVLPKRKKAA